MNPFLLQFANGHFFFLGVLLAAAGLALRFLLRRSIPRQLATATFLSGVAAVVTTATPMPIWLYALWIGSGLVAILFLAAKDSWDPTQKSHPAPPIVFGLFSAALCLLEVPYHVAPRIAIAPGQTVYVLGDSISAGLEDERTWPAMLADSSGSTVVNLAVGGAKMHSAMAQIDGVAEEDAFILIELGGNDLLGSTDGKTFHAELNRFLLDCSKKTDRLAMFELPLPPFKNSFGRSQRALAKKYNVTLIPKRFMAGVLGMPGGTVDGLHFSQVGHDAFARLTLGLMDDK